MKYRNRIARNNGGVVGKVHDTALAPSAPDPDWDALGAPKEQEEVDAKRFTKADNALAFLRAGQATVTFRSKATGTRYTYQITVAVDRDTYERHRPLIEIINKKGMPDNPNYFVALLTGPDNTSDYTYLGMIRDNVFRLTKASKMNMDSVPVKAFRWTWAHLLRGELPSTVEVWHEGRCGRCNRKLTVPESVAIGIGPDCLGRM